MQEVIVESLIQNGEIDGIKEIFAPLLRLNPTKIQIFLHGSCADNSTTSFSDIDDFIVIDDLYYDVAQNELDQVAFNFQKKDPLQHHGHWLIRTSQLAQYDNSFMPLFIMEKAICLMGSNKITASIDHNMAKIKTIERIKNTCKNISLFNEKHKKGTLNIYDLKRYVGSIVLLPPLLYQIKGSPLDKRTAILKANSLYSKQSLDLIQWSTECRTNWDIIIESPEYIEFSEKIKDFDNADEWREYASLNSPIINYEDLSKIQLDDTLIDDFINETLYHIDEIKFQKKNNTDYEKAYEAVAKFCVDHKAVLVGQFGSIKYPSISDLDVFICFEDKDYDKGCSAVDEFIRNDDSLSYLFTHSPLYVCKSFLNDIKYLHTIYDLRLTYNPLNIQMDKQLEKGYLDFLNIAWSYLIVTGMKSTIKNIRYVDFRNLLLLLKNAQTSVFNLEEKLGIKSEELIINHNTRTIVLKDGLNSRGLIESEYKRVFIKLNKLLQELDKTVVLKKNEFRILKTKYIVNESTDRQKNTIYINKIFSNLIYNVLKESDKNSKKYITTIRKNYKLYKKHGGYINTYIWIVPYDYVTFNLKKKLKLMLKLALIRIKIYK